RIFGPTRFDLDLLAYVGATTKNDGSTVGGFGEGFKVCALVALRDFGLELFAGSGGTEIRAVLLPTKLGRELCYRARAAPRRRAVGHGHVAGAWVRLEECDDACFDAFHAARDRFRHADNPKIGDVIASDDTGSAAIAVTSLGWGEIYYRRQERGTIRWW